MILVTGASGYIGGRLIPRLLAKQLRVRVLARDLEKLRARSWVQSVEAAQGNALQPGSLIRALDGAQIAYYLIHSMAGGNHFDEDDLEAARCFGSAAKECGLQRIVYLGGLADPRDHLSRHMRSRLETGEILRASGVPVTEFRAGVIAGPGSISFEMIRYLTEAFPFLICPAWGRHNAQPVDVENVLDYLIAALDTPASIGQIVELGGPDVMPYPETMLEYARVRGLKRGAFYLPRVPASLLARVADWATPVPYAIALPLTEGLSADSIVKIDNARRLFPDIQPCRYRESIRRALDQLHPDALDIAWAQRPSARLIKAGGFLIRHRLEPIPSAAHALKVFTNERRGFAIERTGDSTLFRCTDKIPGKMWLRLEIKTAGDRTFLARTLFFAPEGIPGFIHALLRLALNNFFGRR
jgi:uncharacterized protein YbjT (DUF2867 family)